MSSIRRKNTTPERILRSLLHRSGFRYKLHDKKLPGTPDLVFPQYKAVIFVNGCFWHRHGCYKSSLPKSRAKFWEEKFRQNEERDHKAVTALLGWGWRVMIIWECALVGKQKLPLDEIANKVDVWLKSEISYSSIP